MRSHHRTRILAILSALVLSLTVACGDDGDTNNGGTNNGGTNNGGTNNGGTNNGGTNNGGTNNGGTNNGGTNNGGTNNGGGDGAQFCNRNSGSNKAPVDPDPIFAEVAGSYTFEPLPICADTNSRFAANATYTLTIDESSKAVTLTTEDGDITYEWDDSFDFVCQGGNQVATVTEIFLWPDLDGPEVWEDGIKVSFDNDTPPYEPSGAAAGTGGGGAQGCGGTITAN